MTGLRSRLSRRFGLRVALTLAVTVLAIVAVSAQVVAGTPGKERHKARFAEHPGCHGIANAYSHAHAGNSAEALRAVAEKKGCDLSGVDPAGHPHGDEPPHGDGTDSDGGPPAEVVADKCDRIAERLVVAETRTHGNSAEAFARQAEKWGCPAP